MPFLNYLEEFDERKFCRYFLKLYMRLKELDKNKQAGLKFSKAFSEFTVLVYHNIVGLAGPDQISPTASNSNILSGTSQTGSVEKPSKM